MAELTAQEQIDQIWEMFRASDARWEQRQAELDRRFAETEALRRQSQAELDRRFAETDAQWKEHMAELDRRRAETDACWEQRLAETDAWWNQRRAETDARLDQRIAETDARLDQRFAETSDEIKATNRGLRQLEGLFGNQWGRLIEALVKPGALALFQQRGHQVTRLYENATARVNGYIMEIDIILEDGVDIIVIEVKSRLSVDDVNDFLVDLDKFLVHFPRFAGYQIYGAVAALEIPQDVARYAYRRGLYVVDVSGDDMVQMLNDEAFRPRQFNPSVEA